jgi:lupus La protein
MAESTKAAVDAKEIPEREVSNADKANGTIAAAEERAGKDAVSETPAKSDEKDAAPAGAEAAEKNDAAMTEAKDDEKADAAATEAKDGEKNGDEKDADHAQSQSGSPDKKRKDDSYDRRDNKRQRGGYGGGRGGRRNHKSTFDQPESNDADDIRRQVEFYFSDSNLPIDQYLLGLTGGHRNNPVPLKVIHGFQRMRHFQPYSDVRAAVQASRFLDLNDDDEITRKVPLAEKFGDDAVANREIVHDESMNRSIYAKGFGEETKSTHLDIEEFFAPYGPIKSVRLRRHQDGEFKGSVFVEFESEEQQQQFLELDPKPQWNGEDLTIMSKRQYVDEKHEGILDGSVRPKSPSRGYQRGRGRGRGGYRGDRDHDRKGGRDFVERDDWKNRRDRDQEHDRRHGGKGGRGNKRGGRGGRGGRDRNDRRRGRDDDDGHDHDRDSRRTGDDSRTETNNESRAETNGSDDHSRDDRPKKRAREDGDGEQAGGEAKRAKEERVTA